MFNVPLLVESGRAVYLGKERRNRRLDDDDDDDDDGIERRN